MGFLNTLWIGVESGVPVALAMGAVMMVRRKSLRTALKGVPLIDHVWGMWVGAFFMAALIGVVAVVVYGFLASHLGVGALAFLVLAIGLAVLLSSVAMATGPRGKPMPLGLELSALNFIVALGFGIVVPVLAG